MNFDESKLGDYTLQLLRHSSIVGTVLKLDTELDEIRNNESLTYEEKLYLKYVAILAAYKSGWDK